ncbi:hypothetical protein SK128_006399, partial [Halocaridina rubra]
NLKKHFSIHREERARGCGICKSAFTEDEFFRKLDIRSDDGEDKFACESCYIESTYQKASQSETRLSSENSVGCSPELMGHNCSSEMTVENEIENIDIDVHSEKNENIVVKVEPDRVVNYEDLCPDIKNELQDIAHEEEGCSSEQVIEDIENLHIPLKKEEDFDCREIIYCDPLSIPDIKCEGSLVVDM